MTRYLHCKACASKGWARAHPMDVARGITMRKAFVVVKAPKGHGIAIIIEGHREFEPLEKIHCDGCNAEIQDGSVMVATTFNKPDEDPVYWESQFGTVLSDEAAKAEEILTKP